MRKPWECVCFERSCFQRMELKNGRTIDFVRQRYLNFFIKIKTSKNPTQPMTTPIWRISAGLIKHPFTS